MKWRRGVGGGQIEDRRGSSTRKFEAAGYDHVYVHQVEPDQQSFLDFYAREILPEFN